MAIFTRQSLRLGPAIVPAQPVELADNALSKAVNPFGYWPLIGGSPRDFSGSANNFSITNTNPAAAISPVGPVAGFNGSSQYFHKPGLLSRPTIQNLTICAWVQTNVSSSYVWTINRSSNSFNNEALFAISSGYPTFWDNGPSNVSQAFSGSVSASTAVADGKPHFIVASKYGTTLTYYTDGKPDGSVSAAGNYDWIYQTNDCAVGINYRDTSNRGFFGGNIWNIIAFETPDNVAPIISELYSEPFAMLRPITRRQYYVAASAVAPTGTTSGTAAGTSTATATPAALAATQGAAAGTSTATATPAALAGTQGTAAGTSSALAGTQGTAAAQGTAAGTSTAASTPALLAKAIGASAGIASAIASVSRIISSNATAAGIGGAQGAGGTAGNVTATQGTAAGTGTSLASAAALAASVGASAGIAAALARTSVIARAAGRSAGTASTYSVGYNIMSVLASDVLTRVRAQLVDDNAVQRWSDAELLLWLSDAQRALVAIDASAGSHVSRMPLQPGTRQTIPSDGYAFLGIYRNMTANGAPGRAIRLSRRDLLDTFNPDWHTASPGTAVVNYCFNPEDPLAFYVYPPNDGNGNIEINYSALPQEITSVTQAIAVQPIYQTPLFYYVMAIAHMKDSDSAEGPQMAAFYMQQFINFLTSNDRDLHNETANAKLVGFSPQMKGSDQ